MKSLFSWVSKNLFKPITMKSRMLLLLAVLVLIPTFFLPLWNLEFWSYQYPDGLTLDIYSYKLEGGDDGAHLAEINILNHYIGMAALENEDFLELKWIPFAIGVFIILTLRAVVFGKIGKVLDVLMLFTYFGLFSLWSFWYKLHFYGHNLDPKASVNIEPFTPPIFGFEQVGQFKVWSYPSAGSYLLVGFALLLILAMVISMKRNDTVASK
ncbi:MAG: hypothetical protein GY841_07660 [FCB group bacterium]|nr:hypothetical protein [FCB group bacterium]